MTRKEPIGEKLFAEQLTALNVPFYRECYFAKPRRWRFDFALYNHILFDIQGGTWVNGRHSRGLGYENDCDKQNTATRMGYHVYRVTTKQVKDLRALMLVGLIMNDSALTNQIVERVVAKVFTPYYEKSTWVHVKALTQELAASYEPACEFAAAAHVYLNKSSARSVKGARGEAGLRAFIEDFNSTSNHELREVLAHGAGLVEACVEGCLQIPELYSLIVTSGLRGAAR